MNLNDQYQPLEGVIVETAPFFESEELIQHFAPQPFIFQTAKIISETTVEIIEPSFSSSDAQYPQNQYKMSTPVLRFPALRRHRIDMTAPLSPTYGVGNVPGEKPPHSNWRLADFLQNKILPRRKVEEKSTRNGMCSVCGLELTKNRDRFAYREDFDD